jgi:hypothetical protein
MAYIPECRFETGSALHPATSLSPSLGPGSIGNMLIARFHFPDLSLSIRYFEIASDLARGARVARSFLGAR